MSCPVVWAGQGGPGAALSSSDQTVTTATSALTGAVTSRLEPLRLGGTYSHRDDPVTVEIHQIGVPIEVARVLSQVPSDGQGDRRGDPRRDDEFVLWVCSSDRGQLLGDPVSTGLQLRLLVPGGILSPTAVQRNVHGVHRGDPEVPESFDVLATDLGVERHQGTDAAPVRTGEPMELPDARHGVLRVDGAERELVFPVAFPPGQFEHVDIG